MIVSDILSRIIFNVISNSWSSWVLTDSPCRCITFSCSVRDHRVHRCQAAELYVCFSWGFAYNQGGFALELLFIKNNAISKMNSSSSIQALPQSLIHTVYIVAKVLPEVLQGKFPKVPGLTSSAPDHWRWTWEWKPVERKAEQRVTFNCMCGPLQVWN